MSFPLDSPRQSLWQLITSQPLPARPEGFFLSPRLYKASLHPLTPITIGSIYLLSVFWANARNKAHGGKPKDLIKASPALQNIVLAHNLLLGVYSCWTSANVIVRVVSYFAQGLQAGGIEGELKSRCLEVVYTFNT